MHYLQNEETCQIEDTFVRLSSCVSVPNLVAKFFFFNQKMGIEIQILFIGTVVI